MRKRLVNMLCAILCLTCLGAGRVLASDALQSGCTNGVCGGDLQATAPLVTGNQATLQAGTQGISPQDGTQPSVSGAQILLNGEADHTPQQTNTPAVLLAIVAGVVSLVVLFFVADWFFLNGYLFKRFLPKRSSMLYDSDEIDTVQ